MSRPFALVGLTVFFTLAILGDLSQKTVMVFLTVLIAALIVSLVFPGIRRQRFFSAALASAALACLLLICVNEFYYYPVLSLDGKDFTARITVTGDTVIKNGKYYFEGKATEIDGEKASVRLRLVFGEPPAAEPYDEIEGRFRFFALGKENDYSMKSYKAENRFLGAYPAGENVNIINVPEKDKHIMYRISVLRRSIKEAIMQMLPNDYGGLCTALILGDDSCLSGKAYEALRSCGVTHIICVSGLHISLWSSAILFILRRLKIKEKAACLADCGAVVLFMLLAGMTYSVVRAGIMMLIYILGIIISRERDSLNSLGLSLAIIAAANPFSMSSTSLQLSALATLGIIIYSDFIRPELHFLNRIPTVLNSILQTLFVTCAVTVFTLPVTLSVFGTFNFLVYPANILIVWPAEICMISGALASAVFMMFGPVFNVPGFIAGVCAKAVIFLSEKLSRISFLNIPFSRKEAYLVLTGLFVLAVFLLVIYYFSGKNAGFGIAVFTLTFLTVILCFGIVGRRETRMTVFDVGNGSAVLVSHEGTNVLIDCGGTDYDSLGTILYGLNCAGGRTEALILTGSDKYCTSNLAGVIEAASPGIIACDGFPRGFEILTEGRNTVTLDREFSVNSIDVVPIEYQNGNKCVMVKTEDGSFLICSSPVFEGNSTGNPCRDTDVVVSRSDFPDGLGLKKLCIAVIQAESERWSPVGERLRNCGIKAVSTADGGNVIIRAVNGRISAERG